jgi:hypothetical protein
MMRYIRYPLLVLLNTILSVIYLVFELIFMVFGSATLVSNRQSYNDPIHIYGYIIYNVVTAPFIKYQILKGLYQLWCKDGLKHNILTVLISIFRLTTFIWGSFILSKLNKEDMITTYQQKYKDLFYGFINYYVLSGSILLIGVINFIIRWVNDYKKNKINENQYNLLSNDNKEDHKIEVIL